MLSYNPYGLIIELNMSNNVDYLNNIISYQAMHLFASSLIDDVIISNAYASEEELRALS